MCVIEQTWFMHSLLIDHPYRNFKDPEGWSSPAFVIKAVAKKGVPYKFVVPGVNAKAGWTTYNQWEILLFVKHATERILSFGRYIKNDYNNQWCIQIIDCNVLAVSLWQIYVSLPE